jgi:hypothetical protein
MGILFIALVFLFSSCAPLGSPPEISYPPQDCQIDEGSVLSLVARGEGDISWYDGELLIGNGVAISWQPGVGEHYLSCRNAIGQAPARSIVVNEILYRAGTERRLAVGAGSQVILLAAGSYSPAFLSFTESTFTIDLPATASPNSLLRNGGRVMLEAECLRDKAWAGKLPLSLDAVGKLSRGFTPMKSISKASFSEPPLMRDFWYVDPINSGAAATRISARLVSASEKFEFYLENPSSADEASLAAVAEGLKNIYLPRLQSLFGEGIDIDGNGRVSVLFTSRINDSGSIIGFFNPMDCFTLNEDMESADFNPYSNEMDIVYLAIPESSRAGYLPDSIMATGVHELCHLVRFGQKTLSRIHQGETGIVQENGILDEGLSHLSESLCGLGEKGGNLLFLKSYLAHPNQYSLKGKDLDGSTDSAGKRGAMASLLWHYFEKAGAWTWSETDPTVALDRGGIAFLRSLSQSRKTGWAALSETLGQSDAQILSAWAEGINKGDDNHPAHSWADPLTGQIASVSPYSGDFKFGGHEYSLIGPERLGGQPTTCAAWSVYWSTDFNLPQKKFLSVSLTGQSSEGMGFFGMY